MPANPTKRCWLFAWNTPAGGMNDFIDSFDTVKLAQVHFETLGLPNKQIIDKDTGLPTDR